MHFCPVPTLVLGNCWFHHFRSTVPVGTALFLCDLASCLWLIEWKVTPMISLLWDLNLIPGMTVSFHSQCWLTVESGEYRSLCLEAEAVKCDLERPCFLHVDKANYREQEWGQQQDLEMKKTPSYVESPGCKCSKGPAGFLLFYGSIAQPFLGIWE